MSSRSPQKRAKLSCPGYLLLVVMTLKLVWPLALSAESRPDVLFVLLDDLRHDAMSFMGHPYIETPNIDRLRKRGAWMKNAFVSTSICCPSRASFLTGAYANRHGVIDNETSEVNPNVTPPINQVLKGAGYSTAMIGKWHMGHSGHMRPNWDYWLSFDGQGKYHNPEFIIGHDKVKQKGYTTDLLTDRTIDYIKNHPKDKPYFVMLSHKAVHEPFQPAERHKQAYGKGLKDEEPESWSTDFEGKPNWQIRQQCRDMRWDYRKKDLEDEVLPKKIELKPWQDSDRFVQQLRCVAAVDEGLGRIVEMLESRGTLNNTLIIFTSDNGYFHMEHRRWDKRLAMEETIRIPMLWIYPGRIKPGTTVEEMVMNIDFMPTVLDYVGVKPPETVQGQSMRTCFEDEQPVWRDQIFYEYWTELVHSIPTITALRTERYKLIQYPSIDDIDELYDLKKDPHEMNNLAVLPEFSDLHRSMNLMLAQQKQAVGWREYVFPNNLSKVKGQPGVLWRLSVDDHQLVSEPAELGRCEQSGVAVDKDAIKFDGKAFLSMQNKAELEPSSWPFTIEIECKVDSDGVLLSQSGKGYGYCMFVQDGRPGVSTKCHTWITSHTTIDADESIMGKWVKLKAVIHYNRLRFFLDGELIDDVYLPLPFKGKTLSKIFVGKPARFTVLNRLPERPFKGMVRSIEISR